MQKQASGGRSQKRESNSIAMCCNQSDSYNLNIKELAWNVTSQDLSTWTPRETDVTAYSHFEG